LALGAVAPSRAVLVLYPSFVEGFPLAKYRVGEVPALYEFFQKQPLAYSDRVFGGRSK